MQHIIPIVYLFRSSQKHLESYSVPPNHVGDAVPTVATSWIKRRQSLSTPADVCFSTMFESTFSVSSLHGKLISRCCSRALVERTLCLKWLKNVFSNVQHSRIPVLKFCARHTAGDFSQSTFCVQNFFLEAPPFQPESERATLLQLCGSRWQKLRLSHEVSPRLARQCGSRKKKENNEPKQADQIFKSSSRKFAPLVAKLVEAPDARATER